MMKKILSGFLGLFIAIYGFALGNLSFAQNDVGINLGKDCLTKMGKNCLQYEKIIGIDKEQPRYSAESIVQDSIFAAAYIVGTVLTLVLIISGLGYIFAARGGKDTSKYKTGIMNAAIGSLFVRGAYAIVRLIQYVAQL